MYGIIYHFRIISWRGVGDHRETFNNKYIARHMHTTHHIWPLNNSLFIVTEVIILSTDILLLQLNFAHLFFYPALLFIVSVVDLVQFLLVDELDSWW